MTSSPISPPVAEKTTIAGEKITAGTTGRTETEREGVV